MKKVVVVFVSIFFIVSYTIAQNNGAVSCSKRKLMSKNKHIEKSLNTPKHSFDVLNYSLNLDLYKCYSAPFPKDFTGTNTVKIKVDSVLNSIVLNAVNSSLSVDSISPFGINFTHTNDLLHINFGQTYNPNDTIDFTIYYKHKNITDSAFWCNNGFVFTDCEPIGARKWFPCWDLPYDKATFELKAKVPSDVLLGSNGRLADSLKIADTIYYQWISRDPVATYLTTIASKKGYNLNVTYWHPPLHPQDSVPMRFYYNTGENPQPIINIIPNMLNFFSETFTEHPFEKNGFATLNEDFSWGGMENQTLTSLLPNGWQEMLILHELAHQWFGDMITCATWADLWINEGFATYSEALWLEHSQGTLAYKDEINFDALYYKQNNPGWAISDTLWSINTPDKDVLFNYAITYLKGACVLHQLRYVLGDTVFFDGLKQYTNDNINFKYKNSTIKDFFTKMEEVSGVELDWFMNEWIYKPNHPIYQNHLITSSVPNYGSYKSSLLINQVVYGFYKMPVEIKFIFIDNSDTIVRVMNDQNNQTFDFDFPKQVKSYIFDPNDGIVLKFASNTIDIDNFNILNNNIIISPNPANNFINIFIEKFINKDFQIDIIDLYGRIVRSLTQNANTNNFKVDVSNISKGTYFVRIQTNNGAIYKKVIVG